MHAPLKALLIGHPLQQERELLLLFGVQRGQQSLLMLARYPADSLLRRTAFLRQVQQVAAAVVGIFPPLDKASRFEIIQKSHQAAWKHPQPAGQRLLAALAESGTSVLPAVPSLATSLAALVSRRPAPLPRLRLLTNTGAAMPDRVLSDLRGRLPTLRVRLMYGLTECKRATIMPEDEDLRRPGACGRALPGTEVFAVDGDGVRLPAGETGELVVRGPNVMAGYWRSPEQTARRFRLAEGLFPQLHTGDYGWLDADGYLYFAGRRDDMYKERGFRVSTIEMEAAASRVRGVHAAAVLPFGDGATLFVQSGLSPHEVLRLLRDEIDEVKVPARCVVVPEMPLNANGKIDRRLLARMAGISAHD